MILKKLGGALNFFTAGFWLCLVCHGVAEHALPSAWVALFFAHFTLGCYLWSDHACR